MWLPQVGEIHLIVIKSDSVYACLKVGAVDRSSPSRVRVTLAPHPAATSGRRVPPSRLQSGWKKASILRAASGDVRASWRSADIRVTRGRSAGRAGRRGARLPRRVAVSRGCA
ncbi:hypothetical protein GCM10010350_41980 [Streptomyces galilaeus]|nr:hypothetical protein GCM10010350_41980 [Streptomyces galilaeus]